MSEEDKKEDASEPEQKDEAVQPEQKPRRELRGRQVVEQRIVNSICRRSGQEGGSCGHTRALLTINPRNKRVAYYECEKCGASWTMDVGGTFNGLE